MIDKQILNAYNRTRPFFRRRYLCYAPFKVIRFAYDGIIQVCCLNNLETIGTYPETPILEAWTGEKAKAIRTSFINNKFSEGCFECEKQVQGANFSNVKTKLYDFLPSSKKFPLLMEFMLTNNCNLNCIMCNGHFSSSIDESSNNRGASMPYDQNFVAQLEPFIPHLKSASFIGGEPFMINLYYEIWERMIKINPKIRINISTNGTILNERIKSIFRKGNFEISISIDSINKQTYERIRARADFDVMMSNLKYFLNYCNSNRRQLSVWVCPLTINRYELPEIFEYFNKLDIPVFLNNVYHPFNLAIRYMKKNELVDLKSFYLSNMFYAKSKTQKNNLTRFSGFINELDTWITHYDENQDFFPSDLTNVELKKELFKKIHSYYHLKKKLSIKESDVATKIIIEKFDRLMVIINDEKSYNKALHLMLRYDIDIIIEVLTSKSETHILNYLKRDLL
ncbi:MAG: radical SAM protein [Bacteroidales bacterium]|nr:radical SAM protein [Bacteroidales bacterium]